LKEGENKMKRIMALTGLLLAVSGAAEAEDSREISVTVVSAQIGEAMGEPALLIRVDSRSRAALARFTTENLGAQVLFSVNGQEISRPILLEPILEEISVLTCKDRCLQAAAMFNGGKTKLNMKRVQ
jgi:preprotein translocase subunit SecD